MDEPTGKARGGIARMKGTTAKERKELGRKGAAVRWSGEIKQATHGSDDHPLKIGPIEIPCYVLDDETRVLSQRGVIGGLGMSTGGGARDDRLTAFLTSKAISACVLR